MLAIPLFLFDMTNSLVWASSFTVLVTVSSIISSKISEVYLRRLSPLLLIFWFDLLGAAALVGLGLLADNWFSMSSFLAASFVIGILLNVPNYSKGYFLQKYFVDDKDLYKVSMLQGRVFGVAFVAAVLLVIPIYSKFGFVGVMILDAITYVPLLLLCLNKERSLRSGRALDEGAKPSREVHRGLAGTFNRIIQSSEGRRFIFCNLTSYVTGSFRSHIMLVTFVAIMPDLTRETVAWSVGCGILAAILFGKYLNGLYSCVRRPVEVLLAVAFVLLAAFVAIAGFVHPTLIAAGVGLVLSEIVSLVMTRQRELQDHLINDVSVADLSYFGSISAATVSAFALPLVTLAIEKIGLSMTFLVIGMICLASNSLLIYKPRNAVDQ